MSNFSDRCMVFGAKCMKKYTGFMVGSKQKLPDLIKNHEKLVVIFGHPLCKPCQQIMMKIPFIYLRLKRKGIVLKFCNVTECKSFQISKVPTLVYFKSGKEEKRVEENGLMDYIKKI